jgi:hypothetical protein
LRSWVEILVKKAEQPERIGIPGGKFNPVIDQKTVLDCSYLGGAFVFASNFKKGFPVDYKISLPGIIYFVPGLYLT